MNSASLLLDPFLLIDVVQRRGLLTSSNNTFLNLGGPDIIHEDGLLLCVGSLLHVVDNESGEWEGDQHHNP